MWGGGGGGSRDEGREKERSSRTRIENITGGDLMPGVEGLCNCLTYGSGEYEQDQHYEGLGAEPRMHHSHHQPETFQEEKVETVRKERIVK